MASPLVWTEGWWGSFSQYWCASEKNTIDLIRVNWWVIKEEGCLPPMPQTGQHATPVWDTGGLPVCHSININMTSNIQVSRCFECKVLSNAKREHICQSHLHHGSAKSVIFNECYRYLTRESVASQWNMLLLI